jgi:hypothetical protein
VLPLPYSALKAASGVLRNPANRRRAVPLSFEQFRYGFANAVGETEAKELYETYSVPGSGAPIFQAAAADLNPFSEAKIDVQNPDRGPLLITSGEGPPGARRDREGLVQAPTAQLGGNGARRARGPRALADDRRRLARGRRHSARVHQTLRLSAGGAASLATRRAPHSHRGSPRRPR